MKRIDPSRLGGRSDARERSVELLYEMTQRDILLDELLDTLIVEPEEFAVDLIRSLERNGVRIDTFISENSSWKIERMAMLDLVILRLAITELIDFETPSGVILAESVALASRYSTKESARFINGLAGSAVSEFRSPQ